MAKEKPAVRSQQQVQNSIENFERRLDMLDRRLDDIDSMVSAVIERVMSQPIIFVIINNLSHLGLPFIGGCLKHLPYLSAEFLILH